MTRCVAVVHEEELPSWLWRNICEGMSREMSREMRLSPLDGFLFRFPVTDYDQYERQNCCGETMNEEEEVPEYQGTLRIIHRGSVIPHWRYEYVEGARNVIEDVVRRANAVLGFLPPGDPQFRRNRDRVQRDADREGVTVEWVGVNLLDSDRKKVR